MIKMSENLIVSSDVDPKDFFSDSGSDPQFVCGFGYEF
jgi:hypothetical protein